MKIGLFYEHQLPRPWTVDSEYELLTNALDQIELADRLGIDYVWEVEHHFLEEYSHSSAPEVFLAAASQRTSRIRIGHGIVPLPQAYNNSARVAERIATLDLVSGGRVEFGTGETSTDVELGGFGIPRESKRAQWAEAIDAVTRMFVEEPFAGYDGEFLKMPPRNVVPKPRQRPHPPLWLACSRLDTIKLAAQRGIGALAFAFLSPEEVAPWVDEYYRILSSEECVPAGFAVNPNLAVVVPFMCHEDEEVAIDRGLDGGQFFGFSLLHYGFSHHKPGVTDIWSSFGRKRSEWGFDRAVAAQTGQPLRATITDGTAKALRGAVGTPDQIRDLLNGYRDAGVDQVIFVAQAGNNRHEHVCESLELFGKEVLPDIAADADERERAKLERLAPAIDAALARRSPARVSDPDYVVHASGKF